MSFPVKAVRPAQHASKRPQKERAEEFARLALGQIMDKSNASLVKHLTAAWIEGYLAHVFELEG